MNNKQDIEEIINKLIELLIKQDFEDKEKGKETYVKKSRVYRDLITYFKDILAT